MLTQVKSSKAEHLALVDEARALARPNLMGPGGQLRLSVSFSRASPAVLFVHIQQ